MKRNNTEKIERDEWGAKWFFTLNHRELTTLLMTCTSADMPVPAIAGKVSIEIGKEGNLHKHLYVVLERSWRKSSLLKRFKSYGIQVDRVTPGTEQTVINYIGNIDKEVSKGCTILTEYTSIWGDIESSQGQRNDISASDAVLWQIKDALDAGETIYGVWTSFFPYMVRYGTGISAYANIHKINKVEKEEEPQKEQTVETEENWLEYHDSASGRLIRQEWSSVN